MNMIIQASPVQSNISWKISIASTNTINFINQINRIFYRPRTGVGTKIPRLVLFHLTRKKHAWKILSHRHTNVWIGFVITQHRIIFWSVFFNQITLQHKCLQLRIRNDVLETLNMLHHLFLLDSFIVTWLEILTHAFTKTKCLPYINNRI